MPETYVPVQRDSMIGTSTQDTSLRDTSLRDTSLRDTSLRDTSLQGNVELTSQQKKGLSEFKLAAAGKLTLTDVGGVLLDGIGLKKISGISGEIVISVPLLVYVLYIQTFSSGSTYQSFQSQSTINEKRMRELTKQYKQDLFDKMPSLDKTTKRQLSEKLDFMASGEIFKGDNISSLLQIMTNFDVIQRYIQISINVNTIVAKLKCSVYESIFEQVRGSEGGGTEEDNDEPKVQLPLSKQLNLNVQEQVLHNVSGAVTSLALPSLVTKGVTALGVKEAALTVAGFHVIPVAFGILTCVISYHIMKHYMTKKNKLEQELVNKFINEVYEKLSILKADESESHPIVQLITLSDNPEPSIQEKEQVIDDIVTNFTKQPELLDDYFKMLQFILIGSNSKCNVKEVDRSNLYKRKYTGKRRVFRINKGKRTNFSTKLTKEYTLESFKKAVKRNFELPSDSEINLMLEESKVKDKDDPRILKQFNRQVMVQGGNPRPPPYGTQPQLSLTPQLSMTPEAPPTEDTGEPGSASSMGSIAPTEPSTRSTPTPTSKTPTQLHQLHQLHLEPLTTSETDGETPMGDWKTQYIVGDINYLNEYHGTLTIVPKQPLYECIDRIDFCMSVLDLYYYWIKHKSDPDNVLCQEIREYFSQMNQVTCDDRPTILDIDRFLYNLSGFRDRGTYRLTRKSKTRLFKQPELSTLDEHNKLLYIYSGLQELSRTNEAEEDNSQVRKNFIEYRTTASDTERVKSESEKLSALFPEDIRSQLQEIEKSILKHIMIEKYAPSWNSFLKDKTWWIANTTRGETREFLSILTQHAQNFHTLEYDVLEQYGDIIEEIYTTYITSLKASSKKRKKTRMKRRGAPRKTKKKGKKGKGKKQDKKTKRKS
jgi:hypothetical protein